MLKIKIQLDKNYFPIYKHCTFKKKTNVTIWWLYLWCLKAWWTYGFKNNILKFIFGKWEQLSMTSCISIKWKTGVLYLRLFIRKVKPFKDNVRILNGFFLIVEAFILLISYKRKRTMSVKQHFFRIYRT